MASARYTTGKVPGVTQDHLRVRLLGRFTVDGTTLAPMPVGKARRVLAVLALRAGEFVPVAGLVEALWEDEPPDRADRNIAALVSRLRRALGRERIEGGNTGYRLATEALSVDLREALDLVDTAERELGYGNVALAATSAEQAAKMLDSDSVLAGEREDAWLRDVRLDVALWLRRARICWATAALELAEPDVVVQVAGAALAADPLDEQACRLVMTGHQQAGRGGSALRVYRTLRLTLAEQLGTDPSPETQAVHLAVLRSEQPGRAERAPVAPAAPEPLVGRDTALATLRTLWAATVAGSPALAVVLGEAGIGRTALVERFAEQPRTTGALVIPVSCFEAERSLYLQPLAQAVRLLTRRLRPAEIRELAGARLGSLVQLVPELTEVLGEVDYRRAAPELEQGRGLDALAGLFIRFSAQRPLLLVVEDLHHAGPSTIEALHLLTGRWTGSRIMAVLTERTSEDDPVTGPLRDVADAWLELDPLSPADTGELVRRAGSALDAGLLHARTGGSPLFVTELLRHAGDAGPSGPVPRTVRESVAQRIAHAGDRTAELLSHGAVLGSAFSLDDVASLGGMDVEDGARRAERALRARLLVSRGGVFRFANDIVRQVAYESIPEPVRISRHGRAARMFEALPETAAGHHAAARDWGQAARDWARAADAAHRAFANSEAVELLGHAVRAAEQAGEPALLADVLLRRGQAHCELGHYDAARADHETALELARGENDTELEARSLEQLGWTALYARDALHAVDFAEQATELAESAAAAPGALPSAMLLLGRVRHWDGEYAGAEAAYDRVLAADPSDTTTALALAYRGALLQHQDRFAEARSVLARAAVLCRRTGEFRPMLQTLFFTALARGDTGDFSGALRALGNARRLIDAEQVGFYRAGIETTTSWIWQELGQVDRAMEHARHAVELAHSGGGALELEQELHALLAVADCELLLGHEDAAGAAVQAAEPMLDRSLPFRPRAMMRLLEMRSRWSPEVAEQLLAEARRYSSRKYEALALRVLGYPEAAAAAAIGTGSDLLVAQLGAPAQRGIARDRITAGLPPELRESFVRSGRLHLPAARTR
jgi:DNA-binding SARP family transcriptional activator/tetratricopeptide (TPR) repeat protein